jgi:hypothetical protein
MQDHIILAQGLKLGNFVACNLLKQNFGEDLKVAHPCYRILHHHAMSISNSNCPISLGVTKFSCRRLYLRFEQMNDYVIL